MKKKYIKPVVAVESFQLDAAIDGGCSDEAKVTTFSDGSSCGCGYSSEDGYTYVYMVSEPLCENEMIPGENNGSFCYQGPAGSLVFFSS